MVTYEFYCEECNTVDEVLAHIKEGPPTEVICPLCEKPMNRQYSCNFLLKGEGWPSKEFRKDTVGGRGYDNLEKYITDHESATKEAREVLSHRRKGRKHFQEWAKHNKPAVKRYRENRKKGISGQ